MHRRPRARARATSRAFSPKPRGILKKSGALASRRRLHASSEFPDVRGDQGAGECDYSQSCEVSCTTSSSPTL
eukprot:454436-Pyramimonas_sp.AAC.1